MRHEACVTEGIFLKVLQRVVGHLFSKQKQFWKILATTLQNNDPKKAHPGKYLRSESRIEHSF